MKQYIAATATEYNSIESHLAAPLFRREFDCEKEGQAVLEISAAGFYRVFLNRKELTKGYFAPYISNPDQVIYYDTYCLDGLLKKKGNELLVLLGNGFQNANDCGVWDFENAPFRAAPKFSLAIQIDGEEILTTDTCFQVFSSPITFDDLRCGEWYDARLEKMVFQSPQKPVLVTAPKGEYRKCNAQPIVVHTELAPKEIYQGKEGYLYDFGGNHTGLCRLKIFGVEGQEITMTYGELRDGNEIDMRNISFRRFKQGYIQCDHYICKDGKQEYIPSFTYHGFRYVYVTGITKEQAEKSLLTCLEIYSDIRQRASFVCSDDTVNQIQSCVLNSDTSNFHYFPTDCPHREKNGWTGDIAVSAEQMCYNFDAYDSFREWLYTVRAAQLETGEIPGIIPTSGWGYTWGNGMIWDDVLVELPYQLYRFTGKREIVEENVDAIWRYMSHMRRQVNEDGLLAYGLGDWCETGAPSEDVCKTPLEVSASLTGVDFLRKAKDLFLVMEQKDRAACAERFEEALENAFRRKHIKDGYVSCRSQTAQAMALVLGIFKDTERPEAYRNLRKLTERDKNRMCVGVIGAKYLFEALSACGDSETALKLAADPTYPSYGYMVSYGANTLWEAIREYTEIDGKTVRADGMESIGSWNHHFWGSVSAWFYRRLAGICVISAREVEIAPSTDCGLTWVEAKFENDFGSIWVKWEKVQTNVLLQIRNQGFRGCVCRGGNRIPLADGENRYVWK